MVTNCLETVEDCNKIHTNVNISLKVYDPTDVFIFLCYQPKIYLANDWCEVLLMSSANFFSCLSVVLRFDKWQIFSQITIFGSLTYNVEYFELHFCL